MRRFVLLAASLLATASVKAQLRFEIEVPSASPLHGHLVLLISRRPEKLPDGMAVEPRFQFDGDSGIVQGFGVDVEGLSPGKRIVIDNKAIGYPLKALADLPAGDYAVQAVFNIYEQFRLADGRSLWLPPDKGEGQHWNKKPGNPYNSPVDLHLDPASRAPIKLTLDKVIAAVDGTDEDPVQIAAKSSAAKWLKFIRYKSEKLSRFWGRDMYLGAWVLLPDGFDEHPNARYPLVVYQDHYHANFGVPSLFLATLPPSKKGTAQSDQDIQNKYGYKLYQDWISGSLPRVILIYVQFIQDLLYFGPVASKDRMAEFCDFVGF